MSALARELTNTIIEFYYTGVTSSTTIDIFNDVKEAITKTLTTSEGETFLLQYFKYLLAGIKIQKGIYDTNIKHSDLTLDKYFSEISYDESSPNIEIPAKKRVAKSLPKEATKILLQWLSEHKHDPYPTELEKKELSKKTNLNLSQICNWFINARRRKLPKLLKAEHSLQGIRSERKRNCLEMKDVRPLKKLKRTST
eukprot:TRINITY_DN7475_c0_g1_i1.p1 TRINITY_DN7475_c0_g1~~TRINITY_DN7475_c0_g1_i1.p1  ORF type:complete len:197 (+),score=22.07 TRINITY_DN7475_c0_g1_i1:116-706(+)